MLRRFLCALCALALCVPALAEADAAAGVIVQNPTGEMEGYGLVSETGEVLIDFECTQIAVGDDGEGWAVACSAERLFRASNGRIQFFHRFPDGSEEPLPDWTANWTQVVPLDCEPKRYLGRFRENRYALLDGSGAVIDDDYLESIRDVTTVNGGEYTGDWALGVMLASRGGLWGYLDYAGDWRIKPAFQNAFPFSENLAGAQDGSGQFGYIDPGGSFAIEPRYSGVEPFQNGCAIVQQRRDGRDWFGLIDTSGAAVLPFEYSYMYTADGDDLIRAQRDGEEFLFYVSGGAAEEVAVVGSDLSLSDYMPFKGSKVAKLDGAPTLNRRASYDYRHPRLDGATALFPVYAAFVEAVYPNETRYSDADDAVVTCTKTNRAYERLIAGDADIIFCAGPSDAQIADAARAGVEFELTPFGREAFVFTVNAQNPLEDIRLEQIRGIYSGEITRWEQLGVDGIGEIVAYQRPANSGSQTALERLMGDVPLMTAPQEYVARGMDTILQNVEYRNLPNAIGYSFRFFCTEMMRSEVKLLSIDGVAPTVENIQNGSYPQITTLYAVTRRGDPNPNIRVFLDWITSEQGQELVEKSGYVGYTE